MGHRTVSRLSRRDFFRATALAVFAAATLAPFAATRELESWGRKVSTGKDGSGLQAGEPAAPLTSWQKDKSGY